MVKFHWGMRACGIFILWVATAIALPAQTFTTLHSFDNTDGANPYAGLVQGTDGNLYGAAGIGGADSNGTVFKVTLNGTLTTLYSLCSQTGCTDGANPVPALIQATDGNYYGTANGGGANGAGTVFKVTTNGTLMTLYSFCSQTGCTDGANPFGGLVQGTDGNFYGTTQNGGISGGSCPAFGCGTVFKITPSGALTTLHSFVETDGFDPLGTLVQASNGSFYGTTFNGGAHGFGTMFEITSNGTLTTVYSFCSLTGCTDGAYPLAGVVQGTDGRFYGTTGIDGANGAGTVFRITQGGMLTTLHSFTSTEGSEPQGALAQATDGNFYGTTQAGGANGGGTIFKITPSGTLMVLYSFCAQSSCTDGTIPLAGLLEDTNGTLYGTTTQGGASSACSGGCGTVFSLTVGLGSFIKTNPTSGKVGAPVKILGTNLTGATSVTFNGTAATFTVKSKTEITTTVPTGATTGTVKVVTPGKTLSSNVPFTVRP